MYNYSVLFGLHLCLTILRLADNLSRTLQKQTLSAADGQAAATLTVRTLEGIRTDEAFNLFFERIELSRRVTETDEAALPRKRKAPKRLEMGTGDGHHHSTVADFYHQHYFEAFDRVICAIKDRFNQPGYAVYRNLEDLL